MASRVDDLVAILIHPTEQNLEELLDSYSLFAVVHIMNLKLWLKATLSLHLFHFDLVGGHTVQTISSWGKMSVKGQLVLFHKKIFKW